MGYLELRTPARRSCERETVELRLDGGHAGEIDMRVCEKCELVTVENVRIDRLHQERELGVRALWLLLARLPNFRWTCSVRTGARTYEFWSSLAWWQGSANRAEYCDHMLPSGGRIPAPRETESTAADVEAAAQVDEPASSEATNAAARATS